VTASVRGQRASSKTPALPKSFQSRRATLLGAGALAFAPYSAAWAAPKKGRSAADTGGASPALQLQIKKVAFQQSQKLVLAGLGWGDADAKVLSKALTPETEALTKLVLSNNNITDTGVQALATSIRGGGAPKLKTIVLSGNPAVTEEATKKLLEAREGLKVSFDKPKEAALFPPTDRKIADEKELYRLAFERTDTLFYSELDFGDAEAKALSQQLGEAKNVQKLFLNGNAIQCDGGQAIAASIRRGDAPKLKVLNLAGNRGLTEADRRDITSARKGLEVNFVQLKQKSDAEVYIRADQGKLTTKGAINRAESDLLIEGSGATCAELEQIINIDKAALDVERKLCKGIKDPVVLEKVQATEMKLEGQIARLEKLLEQKKLKVSPSGVGCLDDKNKLAKSTGYPIPDLVGGITAAPRKGLYQ